MLGHTGEPLVARPQRGDPLRRTPASDIAELVERRCEGRWSRGDELIDATGVLQQLGVGRHEHGLGVEADRVPLAHHVAAHGADADEQV